MVVRGCRDEISVIAFFALLKPLGRSLWWWMEVKESQDLPVTEITVAERCAVHRRLGTGRLCTLARVVSLGNTCHM